jgi:hypothetical protein
LLAFFAILLVGFWDLVIHIGTNLVSWSDTPYLIWVMFQKSGKHNIKRKTKEDFSYTKYNIPNTKYKIISAWRYPGVSPKRNPIPEDILSEIAGMV